MTTGILFDLDGTLLDTLQDLTDATNATLRHFGCPDRTSEEVRRFIGNGARQLIRLSLPGGESEETVDRALAWYQQYYAAHAQDKTCPYPGIPEQLAKLRQEVPVAIVSNKPDVAVKILCKLHFPGVYALGEAPGCPRKPAPDMLFQAMRDIGVDRCIYVGDSDVDVTTARHAGMECLSVLWGFRDRAAIEAAGGTHFCTDPHTLYDTLKAML